MFGSCPVAIPTSFEHTRFPTIKEKLKHLQADRQEAFAAHEFAQQWIIEWSTEEKIPLIHSRKATWYG